MSARQRNNVHVAGDGPRTLVFGHGFGTDQRLWRHVEPRFRAGWRTVRFDHVGSGGSDRGAWTRERYASLHDHARDLIEILDEIDAGPVVFVGHSAGAMIGALATLAAPERIRALAMIGTSPHYIDEPGYEGGFARADIDELLRTIDSNYLGWSRTMAPALVGAAPSSPLSDELAGSFAEVDPRIAAHFARLVFLSDHRADIARVATRTLLLQCSEDFVVPAAVGTFMQRTMPDAVLRVIENVGHFPPLSAPDATAAALQAFLAELGD